jgi:predicted NAD/FAD-dependent oxidoreductase
MTNLLEPVEKVDIAIIGSGITGLSCARRLTLAGLQPLILDKGRGVGGRVATRRVEGYQFDHGAQYVHAKTSGFSRVIEEIISAGAAAHWVCEPDRVRTVGVPGMSSLAKHLADGLALRQGVQVGRIAAHTDGYRIEATGCAPVAVSRVVVTVPAPQIPGLLEKNHPLLNCLQDVAYAPCLTLMVVVKEHTAAFVSRNDNAHPLSWIARDGSKPGRSTQGASTWVAQASPEFSEAHLEDTPELMASCMLPLLCECIGAPLEQVVYAAAHRWRYARVTAPLGQPFLASPDRSLYLGGDWCLGPRVEAAWQSGMAIAEDILLHTPVHP